MTRLKQILIFISFFIWDIFASGLIQVSVLPRFSVLQRMGLLMVGLIGSLLYVLVIIRVIKVRQPDFSILPINFKNFQKAWWLIRMWLVCLLGLVVCGMIRVTLLGSKGAVSANQEGITELVTSSGTYSLLAMLFCIIILAPIMEELLFRGLLLDYFDSQKNWWYGPLLSAFLFGLAHVILTKWQTSTLLDLLTYATLGLVLAFVYKKTGRISNSMAVHFMQNLFSTLPFIMMVLR